MANISFSQKIANKLKIDIKKLEPLVTASFDDWLVTDIWDSKRDPWLFFMHKASMMCFVVNPVKYNIEKSIEKLLFVLKRYLNDNGLLDKYQSFEDSLKSIKFFKNSDTKATANINSRRTDIYFYMERAESIDDEHLNYILNVQTHIRLCKSKNDSSGYVVMYKGFNAYLEQVTSNKNYSVKKPDYDIIRRIGDFYNIIPIWHTTYYKELSKLLSRVPENIELNGLCGIACGILIGTADLGDAVKTLTHISQQFDGDSFNCRKEPIGVFLTDVVKSYFNLISQNHEEIYCFEAGVVNPLTKSSWKSLYPFSLWLFYMLLPTFLFSEVDNKLLMSKKPLLDKIDNFIKYTESNKINPEKDKKVFTEYSQNLPKIIFELYQTIKEINALEDAKNRVIH